MEKDVEFLLSMLSLLILGVLIISSIYYINNIFDHRIKREEDKTVCYKIVSFMFSEELERINRVIEGNYDENDLATDIANIGIYGYGLEIEITYNNTNFKLRYDDFVPSYQVKIFFLLKNETGVLRCSIGRIEDS
jgi:hypothetical protein